MEKKPIVTFSSQMPQGKWDFPQPGDKMAILTMFLDGTTILKRKKTTFLKKKGIKLPLRTTQEKGNKLL